MDAAARRGEGANTPESMVGIPYVPARLRQGYAPARLARALCGGAFLARAAAPAGRRRSALGSPSQRARQGQVRHSLPPTPPARPGHARPVTASGRRSAINSASTATSELTPVAMAEQQTAGSRLVSGPSAASMQLESGWSRLAGRQVSVDQRGDRVRAGAPEPRPRAHERRVAAACSSGFARRRRPPSRELAGKVAIESAMGETGRAGDVGDRDAIDAVPAEQPAGLGQGGRAVRRRRFRGSLSCLS